MLVGAVYGYLILLTIVFQVIKHYYVVNNRKAKELRESLVETLEERRETNPTGVSRVTRDKINESQTTNNSHLNRESQRRID